MTESNNDRPPQLNELGREALLALCELAAGNGNVARDAQWIARLLLRFHGEPYRHRATSIRYARLAAARKALEDAGRENSSQAGDDA